MLNKKYIKTAHPDQLGELTTPVGISPNRLALVFQSPADQIWGTSPCKTRACSPNFTPRGSPHPLVQCARPCGHLKSHSRWQWL